jgi:AcrR family transcriptional regulator
MTKVRHGVEGGTPNSREALLRAATALFGEKGPASVSTREIAAEANVNSGLIHRHFRTKDQLLREVLNDLAREIAEVESADGDEMRTLREFFFATRERAGYWKLLARCILDGQDPADIQSEFPTVDRMIELLEEMQAKGAITDRFDARNLAAAFLSLALGYLIFEPWILSATSLDDGADEEALDRARRGVFDTTMAMIASFK